MKNRKMGMVDVIDQQAAGHDAGAKNHHGRQNDFPGIHCAESVWSIEARSVRSKFCERSVLLVAVIELKNTHAPRSRETAAHETAARQSPRTHSAMLSGATRDASNAVTRLSKAYGTRSVGTSARAAAINLF